MKVAAPYSTNKERQNLIDEYNISFNLQKHKIEDLIEWLRKPDIKEKRINIKVISENGDGIPLTELLWINDLHSQIYIRLQTNQGYLTKLYKENQIKFFFDYDFNINNFCRLQDAIDQGVSDIYIMEDLCYRLPQVKMLCKEYNVQIRLLANMISSFTLGRNTDVTSTFYTPENMDALESYYNVIEFELFNSWNRFDTLYKIWFIKKEWKDNLKFINFELDFDIPGESFPRELCEFKMKCGHRCVERQSACRKCQQYVEIAQTMNNKNIRYTTDQKWVEINNNDFIKDIF